jgi:hypothetical protein
MRIFWIMCSAVGAGLLYVYQSPIWLVWGMLLSLALMVSDLVLEWHSPQRLRARADYLEQERERKAILAEIRREDGARRRAQLWQWITGRPP